MHLIAVPDHKDALARGIGLCHQRYASAVNARSGWTGNLWANRFYSSVLDEEHLWRALTPQTRGREPASSANVIDLTEDMFG